MAGAGKALLLAAVGLGLASATASSADNGAASSTQAAEARLQALLATIEQQSAKLDRQQADLERQRDELEKQKAELNALKASLVPGSPADTASARDDLQNSETAGHAEIVKTRYGYIPLPRTAPRDSQSSSVAASEPVRAGSAPTASGADYQSAPLVGRSVKNDLGIPAPVDTASASDPLAPLPIGQRRTLKDLVRSSVAPTLSGQAQAAKEVGEKPADDSGIDIAVLADRGGVLTPQGTLVVDPSIGYTHSSVNRFFFEGVEVFQAVLVGDFQAQDIDRDSTAAALGLRYGITKRLEVDGGTSWLYRHDRTLKKNLLPDATSPADVALSGNGFGDIDFGVHYQINKPKGLFPYFVANLRGKSDTGKGPFDVERNLQTGLEEELPTGSGFWSVEPSVTMIFPSDPAVLFANIGYQWNLEEDVDTRIRDSIKDDPSTPGGGLGTRTHTIVDIGNVDPGDAISASVGMGIGVNDAVSISFGYAHTWVLGTDTEQDQRVFTSDIACVPIPDDKFSCTSTGGAEEPDLKNTFHITSRSADAQIGSFLMGASINVNETMGMNFNVSIGATADAPDVSIGFRTPLSFPLFK